VKSSAQAWTQKGLSIRGGEDQDGPGLRLRGAKGKAVMTNQTHADRVARSLRRLGLELRRTGRTFEVIDRAGKPTPGSATGSLTEIERWISEHIRPRE
jgi:hypothetical protein